MSKMGPRWRKIAKDGPKMAQDGPKIAPRGHKMVHDCLSLPKMAPNWPKMPIRWPQDGPRWPQDGPRWPQDGLIGPELAPQMVPKTHGFRTVYLWARGAHQVSCDKTAGLSQLMWIHLGAISGPSWAVLGPSRCHLGTILGPSWGILGDLKTKTSSCQKHWTT